MGKSIETESRFNSSNIGGIPNVCGDFGYQERLQEMIGQNQH